jgi:hypothetical protein
VRPRILFSNVGIDTNVFNEHDDPKEDFTATVTPALDAALRIGFARITGTTLSDFVYYRDFADERSADPSVQGRAEFELGRFKPYVLGSAMRTEARLNREIDERALRTAKTYGAGVDVKVATRTTLGLRFREEQARFDEDETFRGVNLSQTLDNNVRYLEGTIGFELTPITTFSVIVSREEALFEFTPIRDSETLRITPTLAFSPMGLINGSASFGYRRFEGKNPELPEYSGFVAAGNVTALVADRVKLETRFLRDVQYSYEQQTPYYLLNSLRVTGTTPIAGAFDMRLTGGLEGSSYRALGGATVEGKDHFVVYGAGTGYRFGTDARLGIDVEILERTSERDPAFEYRATRIFASFTWGATK